MSQPYREEEPTEEMSEVDQQLAALGMIRRNDEWVPLLKRQYRGLEACVGCSGFGTAGNPLCGAVYTCKTCGGDGKRVGVPTLWERIDFWFRK